MHVEVRSLQSCNLLTFCSDEQCDIPETIVLKDELDRLLQKSDSKHEGDHDHARGHRINMEVMNNASVVSHGIMDIICYSPSLLSKSCSSS